MATLTTLRDALRDDLQDTGSTTWTNALLERAVRKALGEFGSVWPLVGSATQAATTGQRRYDLSATPGLLWVDAVEHPTDQEPIAFLPFREEARGIVSILGPTLPATGDTFTVWYSRSHTVDGVGSTIPVEYEELILTGAYGYAFLMRASDTIGKINPSTWAPRQARDLAKVRLDEFNRGLKELRNRQASPSWRVHWGARPRTWGQV
jgi:hypothetical protein